MSTDIFGQIGDALAGIAPTIAGVIAPPPFGALASSAVSAIESSLGLTAGSTATNPASTLAALAGMTPDQRVALEKEEDSFKEQMAQLTFETTKLAFDDRASARNMEAQTKAKTPMVLAIAVTLGFFGMLGMMAFHPVPPENKDLFNIMLGALGGAWTTIVAYFFGSSAGQDTQTAALSTALQSHVNAITTKKE